MYTVPFRQILLGGPVDESTGTLRVWSLEVRRAFSFQKQKPALCLTCSPRLVDFGNIFFCFLSNFINQNKLTNMRQAALTERKELAREAKRIKIERRQSVCSAITLLRTFGGTFNLWVPAECAFFRSISPPDFDSPSNLNNSRLEKFLLDDNAQRMPWLNALGTASFI
jgi:hypothetical protein